MSDLPTCPLCGELADPRWYFKGVMFCDGCCPGVRPQTTTWLADRCTHAIQREAALADCERETRKEVEAETVEACAGWLVTAAGAPGGLVRGECESMAKALRSGAWKQGDGETP